MGFLFVLRAYIGVKILKYLVRILAYNKARSIMRTTLFFLVISILFCPNCAYSANMPRSTEYNAAYLKNTDYKDAVELFKEIYKTMVENYYHPIARDNLRKFLYVFNTRLYPKFKLSGASSNFVKWRGSAYLVDALKSPDDIFSEFYPPKEAKQYAQTALGKRVNLGITGEIVPKGYKVTRLQIRADAYVKGLRENDILLAIDGVSVKRLSPEEISRKLEPLEGTIVKLKYFDSISRKKKVIKVESKEYFKQFVFMIPVDVPGVYCLQIERFNRMTGEDLERFMTDIIEQGAMSLIIDLRGNPGGPPLAAREISAFFLSPDEKFAYFQKRNKPKAFLHVPKIPEKYHYRGDMVILVNEGSGSASELFTGILQRYGRAVVMGTNTAGQVFLKSMFSFDDGSMLLLVTARGHHPDGTVFSFDGVKPDKILEQKGIDLIQYAAEYLVSQR